MRRTGYLITFEGSEGAGKSTQIQRLSKRIEATGAQTVTTREPGGTALGEEIRRLLKYASAGDGMTAEAELLLFAAARAQLVREVILPAVKARKVVLCDRYLDSTTVYQGVARNMASEPVSMINQFATGDMIPHLTYIIDLPAAVGLERVKSRSKDRKVDRMESESLAFYEAVREGYLLLAKEMPDRFHVVHDDGNRTPEDIEEEVWDEYNRRIG